MIRLFLRLCFMSAARVLLDGPWTDLGWLPLPSASTPKDASRSLCNRSVAKDLLPFHPDPKSFTLGSEMVLAMRAWMG